MNSREIRKHAQQLLAKMKASEPPVPVVAIAQSLGIKVRSGQLPDDLSGFLVHEDGNVFIGVNSLHPKSRQAFTVAHELGHFLLHPSTNFVDRKLIFFRDARSAQATDVREMQANQFAADLLMPEPMLHKALKGEAVDLEDEDRLSSLAKSFGVSTQALMYRLINLDLGRRRISP